MDHQEQPRGPHIDPRRHVMEEMAQRIATLQEAAETRHSQALWHRLAAQAADLWSEHCAAMAEIYRVEIDRVLGVPELPAPEAIASAPGGPGLYVGRALIAPLAETPEQMRAYQVAMQRLNEVSLSEATRAANVLRGMQASLQTGELAPEDRPQPDPLTVPPSQMSGGHPIVQFPPAPDRQVAPAPVEEPLPRREPGQALDTAQDRHPVPVHAADACGFCRQPIRHGLHGWEHVETGQAQCETGNITGPVASPASLQTPREVLRAACAHCGQAVHQYGPDAPWVHPKTMTRACRRDEADSPVAEPQGDAAQTRMDDRTAERVEEFVQAVTAERAAGEGQRGEGDR
ncbi:hypothetical protein [Actinomadura sp. 21ATH]|uniref:hypothetical protein n=1 Tax=Actinomadura sp. 21ATH TaxID=1735444 RepID=UPI0035C0059F